MSLSPAAKVLYFLFCLFAIRFSPAAETVVLKVASPLPENTAVGQGLERMAADWYRLSHGAVSVRVYHGTLGDDESRRQKIDTGLLDGGLFTSSGVSLLIPEAMAFSAPQAISTQEELDYVLRDLRPYLEARTQVRGFIALAFATGGWVNFFSHDPIRRPSDLRKHTLAVNLYDPALNQVFKDFGVKTAPVSSSNLLQLLQTKAVDVFFTSPAYLSYQWSSYSSLTPYMSEVRVAPFLGCLILKRKSWERVPEKYRSLLFANAEAVCGKMSQDLLRQEVETVAALQAQGLTVVRVTDAERLEWREAFYRAIGDDSAQAFSAETLRLIQKSLQRFHSERAP
jgi:TRAP-type C4-dicarboxylate transport system substrate-binding protein